MLQDRYDPCTQEQSFDYFEQQNENKTESLAHAVYAALDDDLAGVFGFICISCVSEIKTMFLKQLKVKKQCLPDGLAKKTESN